MESLVHLCEPNEEERDPTLQTTVDGAMEGERDGLRGQETAVEPTHYGLMEDEGDLEEEPESEEELDEVDDSSNTDYQSSSGEESVKDFPTGESPYRSKNGQILWTSGTPQEKNPACFSIKETPGPTSLARANASDIKSTFELFFPDPIKEILLTMTNLEGKLVIGDDWKDLDWTDMQAFIGLLILGGVYRSHHEAWTSLWDGESGRPVFCATMPLRTFRYISRVICFSKRGEGDSPKKRDTLAPIRKIWEKWVERLQILYNPGQNITMNEYLLPFRGQCPFKQYMKSKPAKYGVKICAACDSRSKYAWNMQIYTEKATERKSEGNQGMCAVLYLTSGLNGQTITCDHFFTSYALGQELLRREMTMIGMVRSNKPELPPALLTHRGRAVLSSKFAFTDTHTLVSYCTRKRKNMLLMSTAHRDAAVSDKEHRKPEMILDYSRTKGRVNTFDQLVNTHTCQRKTHRWPMVIFYNMLDVSAFNAFVLWTEIDPSWRAGKNFQRRLFLEELGKALVCPLMSRRRRVPRAHAAHSLVMEAQAYPPDIKRCISPVSGALKRKRCHFCCRKKDSKCRMTCDQCGKHICKSHAVITTKCVDCD